LRFAWLAAAALSSGAAQDLNPRMKIELRLPTGSHGALTPTVMQPLLSVVNLEHYCSDIAMMYELSLAII
jgi:hypothetical protein